MPQCVLHKAKTAIRMSRSSTINYQDPLIRFFHFRKHVLHFRSPAAVQMCTTALVKSKIIFGTDSLVRVLSAPYLDTYPLPCAVQWLLWGSVCQVLGATPEPEQGQAESARLRRMETGFNRCASWVLAPTFIRFNATRFCSDGSFISPVSPVDCVHCGVQQEDVSRASFLQRSVNK